MQMRTISQEKLLINDLQLVFQDALLLCEKLD
jgi:hypothetical protein